MAPVGCALAILWGDNLDMHFNHPATKYALSRSDHETQHLQERALLWNPSTRQLFENAGIVQGMRVLDLGSGAGDVALLAADMVGPQGSVLGIDLDSAILETARARVSAAGYRSVVFRSGDVRDIDLGHDFDAVVGRLVLQYVSDPVAVLAAANRHLGRGGIAAFQEADWTIPVRAVPPCALLDRVSGWIREAFDRSGSDIQMGAKLRRIFLSAGFPEPKLHANTFLGGGAEWVGYRHMAGLVRSLLPLIEAEGIAHPEEVAVETLADRLRDQTLSGDGVVFYTTLVSAWVQKD